MKSYREDRDDVLVVQTNTGTEGAFVDCLKFEGQDRDAEARKAAQFLLERDVAWVSGQKRVARVAKRPGWVSIHCREHDEVLAEFVHDPKCLAP